MFEGLFLTSHGFYGGVYGGAFGGLLAAWEQAGVFSYVLPFLLIFAMVFGILTKVKLFGEARSVNAILALVVGLLALQFSAVPFFFFRNLSESWNWTFNYFNNFNFYLNVFES